MSIRSFFAVLTAVFLIVGSAPAQSTGSIQGTVIDPTGATVAGAQATVRPQSTGVERTTATDSAGVYLVPSLPVGTYRVEVKAPGMETMAAPDVELSVGTTVRQDFSLKVAATSEVIEVQAAAGRAASTTFVCKYDQQDESAPGHPRTGRHFMDLALLIPVGHLSPTAP